MSLRQRPVGPVGIATGLRCDHCGQPAEWRHRVTSACCMVGEALCEQCEGQRALQLGRDSYWADLREDARRLAGQMGGRIGQVELAAIEAT